MPGEFTKFQKQFPLTSSKNPQLSLFPEVSQPDIEVKHSPLFQNLLGAQNRKFARFSSNAKMRSLAEPAVRFRDVCRNQTITEDYPWEWPDFGLKSVFDGLAESPRDRFSLTGLQTRQQHIELERLFGEISQHVAHALSRPCPVFADRHAIRVEFMDCFAWVALKIECELCIEIRDANGDWHLSVIAFNLMKPLHTPAWIAPALLPWVPEIVKSFGAGAQEAYDWLREKLVKRFQNERSLGGLRRQVFHHMNVAPAVTSVMLQVRQGTLGRSEVLNTEYGEKWRIEAFWTELYQRSPGLMLFYHFSVEFGFINSGDGLGTLRKQCLDYGLSPAAWRFLARGGDAAFDAAIAACDETEQVMDNAISLLNWQSQAGLDAPFPRQLARNLIIFNGMMAEEGGGFTDDIVPRIALAAARHWQQLEDERQRNAFAEEDWLSVLIWLRDARPAIDRNQWRAGWPAIWRCYQKWVLLSDEQYRWKSVIGGFTVRGLQVKPLTSSRDLALEGLRMRHCVSVYSARCHVGEYRLFSILDAGTGKNLATVGLQKEGEVWKLDQAKGKLNRDVNKRIYALGRVLAKLYRNQKSRR